MKFSRHLAVAGVLSSLVTALTVGAPAATSQTSQTSQRSPAPSPADVRPYSHEGEQQALLDEQVPQSAMPRGKSTGVISPIDTSGFHLRLDTSDRERVLALERHHRQLRPASLTKWLHTHSRPAVHLPHCPTKVPLRGADGFCWKHKSADDLGWAYVPQGLTGSGEAHPRTGRWNGRRIVATSWASSYDHPSAPPAKGKGPWAGAKEIDHFMRVSFTDVTSPARPRYRSALLVVPRRDGSGFKALHGHADTLSWYGNHLFLYSSERLHVFDLRHLWATNAATSRVGVSRGRVSANWQSAALPQVAQYSFVGSDGCGSRPEEAPCFSGASIDHTSASSPALVTVEKGSSTSRVVRWPLSPRTHLLHQEHDGTVQAQGGYRVPLAGPQGVVQRGDRFFFSATCPGARRTFGEPYCLYRGSSGGHVDTWSRTPAAAENLFYWPSTGRLWVANESPYRGYVRPHPELNGRVVYNVRLPRG
ncbi:hypothetical protein [Streptomyces sp. MST-110588]|uniref:hypothetical protein n=1 Tax=Streptomyces sp. MST-110588 TaxID=2833628 RepID=UPI001F5C6C84|nr:hypothetical protein [Streptomyces sp. MST-110588]UNO43513.1 hypothetical protein KGS77_33605 [Streptomyces sp. MST-110588]